MPVSGSRACVRVTGIAVKTSALCWELEQHPYMSATGTQRHQCLPYAFASKRRLAPSTLHVYVPTLKLPTPHAPGWGQHHGKHAEGVLGQLLQDGQRKRRRLAAAGLGRANAVAACVCVRVCVRAHIGRGYGYAYEHRMSP